MSQEKTSDEKRPSATDASDEEHDPGVLVIDNGSCTIKCGFGSDESCIPRSVFPCVVGKPRIPSVMVGLQIKDHYVGDEAKSKRGILTMKYPIENGSVRNWDAMEKIWHHAFFNELRVDPSEPELRTIITENVLTLKEDRERLAAMMFETFNTSALFIASRPLMSLYGSGRTTGVVVHIGHGTAAIVPIHDGRIIEDAIMKLPCAGKDVTDNLAKIMAERGFQNFHFCASTGRECVQDMKEKFCYVAQDFELELKMAKANPSLIETALDADEVADARIGEERFRCAEILFKPELGGIPGAGLHTAVWEAVNKCGLELRPELLRNVVMSGGTCMLPGIADRLRKEVRALASDSTEVGVEVLGDLAAYTGAHILSSVPEFEHFWVTKEQYDEEAEMSVVLHKMSA